MAEAVPPRKISLAEAVPPCTKAYLDGGLFVRAASQGLAPGSAQSTATGLSLSCCMIEDRSSDARRSSSVWTELESRSSGGWPVVASTSGRGTVERAHSSPWPELRYDEALQEDVYCGIATPDEDLQDITYLRVGDTSSSAFQSSEATKPEPLFFFESSLQYDEALQESVYSKGWRGVPVKNTFIHYGDCDTPAGWSSAPPILLSCPFHERSEGADQTHVSGNCRPCAYFLYKGDGCRWGDECEFCHACSPGEHKRRKRAKVKAFKAQGRAPAEVQPTTFSTSCG